MTDHRSPRFEEAPESESWRKLLRHAIDEMPWRVVGALAFVGFFFVYGAINSAIKMMGRDLASVDFPAGPLGGAIAALGLVIWIAREKHRRRNLRR